MKWGSYWSGAGHAQSLLLVEKHLGTRPNVQKVISGAHHTCARENFPIPDNFPPYRSNNSAVERSLFIRLQSK